MSLYNMINGFNPACVRCKYRNRPSIFVLCHNCIPLIDLAGLMKIRVSDDPMYCRTLVRGEVQVIPPDHRLDLGAELRRGK